MENNMLLKKTELPLEINEDIGKETLVRCPANNIDSLDVTGIINGTTDCDEVVVYVAGIKKNHTKYENFTLSPASLLGKNTETRGRKKKEVVNE